MISHLSFDDLVSEALSQEFTGWDFSWLKGRWKSGPLPWNYRQSVQDTLRQAGSLLDMGTGGGEFLASLAPLPALTCATEGYAPNVPVARARLEPLGVQVAAMEDSESNSFAIRCQYV